MCHIALLMPALGISLFWLMPLGWAIPSYGSLLAVSGLVYWSMMAAMRARQDKFHGLVGAEAEVVGPTGLVNNTHYLVRVHGELWSARSSEALRPKEKVHVTALDGITLSVERRRKQA